MISGPAEVFRQCTIFLKNVDPFIMDLTELELLTNLNEMNQGKLRALYVNKLPSGKTLKFECESSEMAAYALKNGFILAHLVINPRFLSLEVVRDVQFCYRCYAIENHKANNCPKPQDFVVCSNCSGNHNYKNCRTNERKCINCSGNHSTMSKYCPKYKIAVSNKSQPTLSEIKSSGKTPSTNNSSVPLNTGKTHASYASIAKNTLSKDDMFRGYMCMLMASNLETSLPGSFNKNLNKLLSENGLPSFETAGLVPSVVSPCLNPSPIIQLNNNTERSNQSTLEETNNDTENMNILSSTSKPSTSSVKDKIHSFESSPRPIRSVAQKKCIIHIKKSEKNKIFQRKNLEEDISSNNVVLEHNCPDETVCILSLSKLFSEGITTSLSIKEHNKNQFLNALSQFKGSDC